MTSEKEASLYDLIPELFDISDHITNLPITFMTSLAKPNDKKGEPLHVVRLEDYIRLGITVRKLVSKVNYLSDKLNDMAVANMTKSFPNIIAEFAGKSLIPKEEDVATIIQWHKDVFPEACFEGQTKKWEEEYGEFLTARTHKDTAEMVSELADLFIVACGIMRFNLIQGCKRMLLWNELRYTHGWALSTCKEAINKKMAKNRARKWEYMGNGNYHHVKGVGD